MVDSSVCASPRIAFSQANLRVVQQAAGAFTAFPGPLLLDDGTHSIAFLPSYCRG